MHQFAGQARLDVGFRCDASACTLLAGSLTPSAGSRSIAMNGATARRLGDRIALCRALPPRRARSRGGLRTGRGLSRFAVQSRRAGDGTMWNFTQFGGRDGHRHVRPLRAQGSRRHGRQMSEIHRGSDPWTDRPRPRRERALRRPAASAWSGCAILRRHRRHRRRSTRRSAPSSGCRAPTQLCFPPPVTVVRRYAPVRRFRFGLTYTQYICRWWEGEATSATG